MKEQNSTAIYRAVAFIALLIGFLWFLQKIAWVIKIFVISLLIVYVLFPVAEFFKKRLKLSHLGAVGLTFAFFLFLVALLISLIVPVVQREIQELLGDLPFYLRQIHHYMEDFAAILEKFNLDPEFIETIPLLSRNLQPLLEQIASVSVTLLSSLVDIFFILFMVFYLLYDFQNVRNAALKFIPPQYAGYAENIIRIVDYNFGGYIRGNIVRCTIVGLITGIALFAAGMPYALLLGILAGALNIILYIGPYLAAIPAILLSISPQTPSTIFVLLIYAVVQGLDGVLLSPLLLGRAVKLKPITVIVSMLIGQQLAGVLGMILSTPIAGIVKSLLEYFLGKETCQDEISRNFPGGSLD